MKQFSENTHIALLHYPVYDRTGRVVATSVANMDVHDISRCARTFGIGTFYIVNPMPEQRSLVRKILDHWRIGYGATFNPSRKEAFDRTKTVADLDEALRDLSARKVKLVATGASLKGDRTTFEGLRRKISSGCESYLILFGTGSGLAGEVVERCDDLLEPIQGPGEYHHLSVRSAVAIVLDRLFGNRTE